jgi:hypothetical protein
MVEESAPSLCDAALRYARAGIPVFPCAPGGKVPATVRGFHDATTDPEQVARWWARQPAANIGMPTGALPGGGLDVLDLDVRDTGNGWEAFHRARRNGLVDGWIRVVVTPSGGLHLHYPGTTQRNGSLPRHHLDFRGQGGYVLLPPSIGRTPTYDDRYRLVYSHRLVAEQPGPGRPLDWGRIRALLDPPTSPPPATVARAGRRPGHERGADPTGWLAAHVARQTEGNRNGALFWAACRALDAHSDDLEPLVHAAVAAGLTEREARRTIRSAQDRTGRPTVGRLPSPAPRCPPSGLTL